jgi:hypothetical protein
MISDILKQSIRFIALVLLQVLIVQNIRLGSFVILFPYVLFLLLLPFELSRIAVLFLSFFTGLAIDFFYDTAGMHAAACTLIGFLRHYVLKILSPRGGYEIGQTPTAYSMGSAWFITYSAVIIFIHHFFFFYLEVFRFSEFFRTLFRIILSSFGTFILVYVIQFLFYNTNKNK